MADTQHIESDAVDEFTDDVAEFESITITLDHLARNMHPNGEFAVKLVLSDMDAHQAVLNQISYFVKKGEGREIRGEVEYIRTLSQGLARPIAYFYTPCERLSNIIVDRDVWVAAFLDPTKGRASMLETVKYFTTEMFEPMFAVCVENGKDPTLLAYVADDDPVESYQQPPAA